MTYYIFRHGETHESKYKINYGENIETAEILPEATPVTKRLAYYLKNERVGAYFSSPYLRCKQTMEIIKKITGKGVVYDKRIGEEKVNRNLETFEDMFARVKEFHNSLIQKNIKSASICTHGGPIAILSSLILSGKVNQDDLSNYPKTGVLLVIEEGKLKSLDFNRA
ncbi:hypothetical protein A2955_02965 [Candidatus Woesebacteria bacterium RIFCSPLOWO2_01_FULL_37_19]|uniref:Phosphoglycerate mutase n=2 Tax=Candidatus Woeseibacteriota TaxID=1752722 RepID=A0A1F8BBI9_9BACT|nr:MAG: hypothetical protein A2771_00120 [Candidatus Woesebacteria bacterium RIFCSPHIGHO2_01_FULL_38_26b]OGM61424.1 MAG: hypothetical protein A2955_02965 [Candidatus Woesebacteria bacterium RIFCSPLOWO2_01_FULL_37_19]